MLFFRNYRWLLPSLLFFCVLLLLRMWLTHSVMFGFLLWNLFLAAVPLFLAWQLRRSRGADLRQACWGLLWLLFFPNSPYITTDLFHLWERPEIPLWFDLLLILSAAINGLLYGFLSLYLVERELQLRVGQRWMMPVVFCLLLACGFGIYLGRYLRWNSWDIVAQPADLLLSVAMQVRHPFRNSEAWLWSLIFAGWSYPLYRIFGRLRLK